MSDQPTAAAPRKTRGWFTPFTRAATEVPARFEFITQGLVVTLTGTTVDLAAAGATVATHTALPSGTEGVISLDLPLGPVSTIAVVRASTDDELQMSFPALEQTFVDGVAAYLRSLMPREERVGHKSGLACRVWFWTGGKVQGPYDALSTPVGWNIKGCDPHPPWGAIMPIAADDGDGDGTDLALVRVASLAGGVVRTALTNA